MSDSTVTHALTPSPLAHLTQAAQRPPRLMERHGVQTPEAFEPIAQEIEALTRSAAVYGMGWLRHVAVRGEDRFRWLSGMVTNTVNDLGPQNGAWNFVLNAQGRILGDLHVWRENDELVLEIAADQMDKLLAHFEHFIIMDDVELVRLGVEPGAEETALGLAGPEAGAVLERMGLKGPNEPMSSVRHEWNGRNLLIERVHGSLVPHYIIWTPVARLEKLWYSFSTAGAQPVGAAALEAFRIAEGMPVYGVDIAERDLPQETSQMRALHFSKGCYLGQEIVERIHSRGNVHRHLRQLELEGPLPAVGTEIMVGPLQDQPGEEGKVAGTLTSVTELTLDGATRRFAIGMIRGEAEARHKPMPYTTDSASGNAWILDTPPIF
jgi:folate-binding protein YgfZ